MAERGAPWRHHDVVLARVHGCCMVRRAVRPTAGPPRADDAAVFLLPIVVDGSCGGLTAHVDAVVGLYILERPGAIIGSGPHRITD